MPMAAGLHYDDHGDPAAPPLVLSAGLGGAGAYWTPNLEALRQRFRVITYDQRGTGRSAGGALRPDLTLDHMADDLVGLLDALGIETAALVGHALGAHIGFTLAARRPHRLTRLVAINAWTTLDPLTARCFDVRLALLRDSGPEAFFRAQPLFLYPGAWISEHDAALEAEAAAQVAHFSGRQVVESRVAALRAFTPNLAAVTCPVLCLAADDDMLVPGSASRALADALPDGVHATLPWGGHACNVTDPRGFEAAVIPWLCGEPAPAQERRS